MAEAAELIHARFAENAQLLTAARKLIVAGFGDPDAQKRMASGRERLKDTLTALIEPDAAQLRRPPAAVAQMLLLFCGANTYGPFGDPDGFRGAELVSLLLDGFLTGQEDKRGAQ